MPRPPSPHPTDVELEILQVLWSQGPSSLSSLCETLRTEREVAATTVATMLRVMSDKGLVKRTGGGRGSPGGAADGGAGPGQARHHRRMLCLDANRMAARPGLWDAKIGRAHV